MGLSCAVLVAIAGWISVHAAEATAAAAFASELYVPVGRAGADDVVPLVVGLRADDFDALERRLWQVSDPTSRAHGEFLARSQADELSRPAEGAVRALRAWLRPLALDNDPGSFSSTSNLFRISIPARRLEEALGTEIHRFELRREANRDPARRKLRFPRRILRAASEIAVPEQLEPFIAFLSVNSHPLSLRAVASSSTASGDATQLFSGASSNTLELIRHLYGIPDDLVATNEANSQCVPSFYDEAWSPSDLEAFHAYSLPEDALPRVVAKGDRVNHEERPTTEASLDIQYVTGIGRNATTYMWTMNGSNPFSSEDEPFVEFVEAVLAMDAPPLVVSISYSDDEEHIFAVSGSYARSLDTLLIKMGLRGITVLVASGDDGVTGLRPEFERIPHDEICKQSGPQWPSSSPYITTVGATMILSAEDIGQPFFKTNEEVVCSSEVGGIITTGGGFSNVYSMPDYQREAVGGYLNTSRVPTTPGFFNASGRAYPDISALGASFMVYINGRMTAVSGTSASTPVVGGMVTLWNDLRLNAGKSSLGFLNPLLYYMQKNTRGAFHDVVTGNNGAPRGGGVCDDSFGATAGWDAVTGVGTPNFQVIADFVLSLGDHFDASALGTTTSCASSTTASIDNTTFGALTGDETDSSSSSSSNTAALALLILGIVGNAVIAGVMLFGMYKRWRNQYTPLGSGAAGAGDKRTPRDGVSAASPLRRNEPASDADVGAAVGEEVELSEINLHD